MEKGSMLGTIFVILQLLTTCSAGPQCYDCDRVAQAGDCDRITTCGDHQKCFAQRFIGSRLNQYYKLGCIDKGVCAQDQFSLFGSLALGKRDISPAIPHGVNKRDDNDDMVLCLQCCDGERCNSNLCGAPPTSFQRCFNCKDVLDPKDCDHVTECGRDRACSVHKKKVATTNAYHYEMSCMSNYQCAALERALYNVSTTLGCFKCCSGSDYCNYKACDGWVDKTTTASTIVPTHASVSGGGTGSGTGSGTGTGIGSVTMAPLAPTHPPRPIITGNSSALYSGKVTLQCHSNGNIRDLTWNFNQTTTLPPNVVVRNDSTGSTLSITHLDETNAGQYICLSVNKDYHIESSTSQVTITDTPAFVLTLTKTPVGALVIGEKFSMHCTVIGYPAPTIKWSFHSHDGSPDQIPTDVHISPDKRDVNVANYSSVYHDGTWTCSAMNYLNKSEKSVTVGV